MEGLFLFLFLFILNIFVAMTANNISLTNLHAVGYMLIQAADGNDEYSQGIVCVRETSTRKPSLPYRAHPPV